MNITKFEELSKHPKLSWRKVADSLFRLQPASLKMISEDSGLHINTIRAIVRQFRSMNMIYVAKWENVPPSGRKPYFRVGNEPDMPIEYRCSPHYEKYQKGKKRNPTSKTATKKQPVWDLDDKWAEMARAFVPSRTKEEVMEINRLYLNWISGGEYERV